VNWIHLNSEESLMKLLKDSETRAVVIFKHSNTCSISHSAKYRLEDNWSFNEIDSYLLDIKSYRNISNMISEMLNVHHESPQLLLLRNRECIYDASHFDISAEELRETIAYHE
jgi:bacillithiol system protein YtxJ